MTTPLISPKVLVLGGLKDTSLVLKADPQGTLEDPNGIAPVRML